METDNFGILEKQGPSRGGEVQLTDAIDTLNKIQNVFALKFKGKRYDVGNKVGMLEANIKCGLEHPGLKGELREYLKSLVEKF